MMETWSFADELTGIFTGRIYAGPRAYLADNTPAGQVAVLGSHDHLSRRLDVESGDVVDWQPPAPAADEFTGWAWDAASKRWVSVPTAAAVAREVRAERDRRMAACDWVVMRAQELGQAVPTAWSVYRQALRDIPQQAGFPATVDWPTAPA